MRGMYGGRDLGAEQQKGFGDFFSFLGNLYTKSGLGMMNPGNPIHEKSRRADELQKQLLAQGMDPLKNAEYMNLIMDMGESASLDPGGAGLMVGKIASKATKPLATAQDVIEARAGQMDLKPQDRIQPSGQNPLFELTPEAYERTSGLLKQERLPGTPRVGPGEKFPLDERMRPIQDNMDEIAEIIANKSRPALGTETQYFYNMGPVYEGLINKGYSRNEILDFFKEFGEGYGATSPRTNTEFNMRHAMLLRSKEGRGMALDSIEGPGSGGISEKGFPMMDMHRNLYRDFVDEVDKMNTNPKPTHFKSGAQGNLLSVTADTHAIRGALVALNDLKPGGIPEKWFANSDAYKAYKKNPNEWMANSKNMGKIKDGLASKKKDGVSQQVEYGTMHDLYERVGEKLGVTPAEAQSLAWFSSGANTNLASQPKSIPRLLDERIDVTAQALGLTKDQVLELVVRNKLPLMGVGMAGLLNVPEEGQN